MERYESYKPSGVEWIGDIPSEWSLKRLKFVADVETGGTPPKSDENNYGDDGLPWIKPDNLNGFTPVVRSKERISSKGLEKMRTIPTDSVLVCGIGSIGKFGVAGCDLVTNQQINSVIFGETVNPSFGKYLISSSASDLIRNSNKVVVAILSKSSQSNILYPVPSLPEQETIANYLDRKTEEIDKLITNKQKLIELLKEERTAIINQAVTKGIKPNAKLKPSGIEWLGDIPEHWEIKKLKYLVSKVGSGVTPLGGATVYQTGGIPLLRSQNIYSDGLVLDDVAYITEEIDESMSNSRIEEGDVLLNITGASIGRSFYVPKGFGRGNVNQHVCIIRPIPSLLGSGFLHSILVSGYGQNLIDMCQVGANREGLNFQQLRNFSLPYCSLVEQQRIVDFIKEKSESVSATVSKVEKEIELMREYRTALISEVVTGKIKVC